MTIKNESKNKNNKTSAATPKEILYEAVQKNPTRNYIIMGALTQAGLYNQYKQEETIYGVENIKPSITTDELNKIIKNYMGE